MSHKDKAPKAVGKQRACLPAMLKNYWFLEAGWLLPKKLTGLVSTLDLYSIESHLILDLVLLE